MVSHDRWEYFIFIFRLSNFSYLFFIWIYFPLLLFSLYFLYLNFSFVNHSWYELYFTLLIIHRKRFSYAGKNTQSRVQWLLCTYYIKTLLFSYFFSATFVICIYFEVCQSQYKSWFPFTVQLTIILSDPKMCLVFSKDCTAFIQQWDGQTTYIHSKISKKWNHSPIVERQVKSVTNEQGYYVMIDGTKQIIN